MASLSHMTVILSAFAGAKARQLKREAMAGVFIALMALLTSMFLLAAFAAYIAQSHGPVIGLLSAAAVAVFLAIVAMGVRAWGRRRARRRQRVATSSAASAMAASAATGVIANNKVMTMAAGLAIGVLAGVLVRSGRD
tara:strand:- start:7096 stop:7509 length:414 start_codon:yes stop_codon:yes gene_type:complete